MRFLILIVFLISCKTNKNRTISLPEIGWSFELPKNISFKDSAFGGDGKINQPLKMTSFSTPMLQLFWIESDKDNYFNTLIFVDSSDGSDWTNKIIADSKYYLSELSTLENYKIVDTSLSTEIIDRTTLQREYFKIHNMINNGNVSSYKFSRKFGHYSVFVNIRFADETIGNRYLEILRNSKFAR